MSNKKPTRKHTVVPPKFAKPAAPGSIKPSITVSCVESTPRIEEVTTVAIAVLPDIEPVITITKPAEAVIEAIEVSSTTVTVTEVAAAVATPAVEAEAIPALVVVEAIPAVEALAVETPAPAIEAASPAFDITPLLRDLHDTDADIACEAAIALGQQGDASAVEPLIEALSNTYGYYHSVVRAAAAASLGQLRDSRAFYPLTNAINEPAAEASVEAVRALALLGDDRAIDTLIEVVRDRDNFYLGVVRRAAVAALGQLGGERAVSELRFVAADSYENLAVRDAASEALGEHCHQQSTAW